METNGESTAAINATSKTVSVRKPAVVPKSRFAAERDYRISRILFQSMLYSELISDGEFSVIDSKIREKYAPISGNFFL